MMDLMADVDQEAVVAGVVAEDVEALEDVEAVEVGALDATTIDKVHKVVKVINIVLIIKGDIYAVNKTHVLGQECKKVL